MNDTPTPPLPASTKAAIEAMRDELTKARLGHFGRRIGMLVEQAHESRETYARSAVLLPMGTNRIEVPIQSSITITAHVKVGQLDKTYTFDVGGVSDLPRTEVPLGEFSKPPATVTIPVSP